MATGVPMEEALTPAQCERMRQFLRALVAAAAQAEPGTKLDVGAFMAEWRHQMVGKRGRTVRAYRRWEKEEIELLHRMYRNGMSMSQIAKALNRAVSSVSHQLKKVGRV